MVNNIFISKSFFENALNHTYSCIEAVQYFFQDTYFLKVCPPRIHSNKVTLTSGPVSTWMGDRVLIQFPVWDIYLGM